MPGCCYSSLEVKRIDGKSTGGGGHRISLLLVAYPYWILKLAILRTLSAALPVKTIEPSLEELNRLPTPLTAGERAVLDYFAQHLGQSWEIYVQPHLNGFRPDFVLLNPKVGIAVVEVKDWDLTAMDYSYVRSRPEDVPRLQAVRGSEIIRLGRSDPVSKIDTYKDAIFSVFCPRLATEGYGRIVGIVAFPFARRADIEPILQPARQYYEHEKYCKQNTLLTLDEIAVGDKAIRKVLPTAHLKEDLRFSSGNALDLRHWLVEPAFSREQRRPLLQELDTRQRAVVSARTGSRFRKIRGAAGSGKSLVLAARAASLAKEGKSVLLITFNITLISYLRDYVVRVDRDRAVLAKIEVWNFHLWCKLLAIKAGHLDDYIALWTTKDHRAMLETTLADEARKWCADLTSDERYDAVFVDEGQDFRREWWLTLRSALKPEGEMLLAVDRAQNIYGVENWVDGDLRHTGLSSTWYELPVSYRMPEPLIDLAAAFAQNFLPASEAILPSPANRGLDLTPDRLSWTQCDEANAVQACLAAISNLLKNSVPVVAAADLTFITDDSKIGLAVVEEMWTQLKIRCIHTLGTPGDSEEKRVRESRRKKLAFHKGDGRAKVTTIQSFKGWESSALVLYVSKAENADQLSLVYTGMTRLKALDRGALMSVVSSEARLESFGRQWPVFARFGADLHDQ